MRAHTQAHKRDTVYFISISKLLFIILALI